ncbi:MAG TPA: asparaginase [Actinomycetota bacterium]|nr:asparaginase [Actinomycetota bacterium]
MAGVPLVRAVRSGLEESVHLGSVAVADADGRLVAMAGDPARVAFARSSMKPLQAAVSLSLAGDELPDAELAVMCASHSGEAVHVDAVRGLLAQGGFGVEALRCPPALPADPRLSASAHPRSEVHNCSGKHAGMLLACARRAYEPGSYVEAEHPVQRAVLAAVRRSAGEPRAIGVDGCGVPVHALALRELATLYARLARPERLEDLAPAAARAVDAMRAEPYLVGGAGRVCTDVAKAVPGVVVKVGAEGLVCAAITGAGLGVAVKAEDGSARAQAPAILHALRLLGVLEPAHEEGLAPHARPPLLGGGRVVGHLEPSFDLRRA